VIEEFAPGRRRGFFQGAELFGALGDRRVEKSDFPSPAFDSEGGDPVAPSEGRSAEADVVYASCSWFPLPFETEGSGKSGR